ncbi:TolC family protein [Chryseolinea lacunae]|uniref:TolC family protein n=1 Tax=Chryseolinea lacunae TaxID=2801331 RepID=A0ABS1KNA8_9BACT|nr:TolC family protein [Chryseolinea lacunae]MBL0740825.1 TolC family protein [Chryseolinea lacunae]
MLQADSLLVARNLSLLAYKYEVDMADARTIQEKLFSNPQLYTEWNLYNPTAQKWFDTGKNGQKIVQLQQVFRIAGQRKTSIRLAEEEKRMTQWQYYELARSLKYELHVSFYRYYYLNNAIVNIRSRLDLLKNLIGIYELQYNKGNISLQELTRLKSTYFEINNKVNDTQTELVRLQENLKVLLADDRAIAPRREATDGVVALLPALTLPELLAKSMENRPEIKEAQSIQAQHQLRYSLARKEAIPNLTGGAVYDQNGSYVPNYTGVSVGLQIPLFNRNQGKIRESKIGIAQADVLLQSRRQEITRQVEAAWKIYQLLDAQYKASGTDFEAQLDLLSKGLVSNYSKNNISLLEFTDMFEAYNSSIIEVNQLKADLNKSYEELNYAVGEDLR